MDERITHHRLRFEHQRRLAYRVAGSLGMAVLLYAQFTILSDLSLSYTARAIYAVNHIVMAGFTCWVLWALAWGRQPLARLEQIMLLFFAIEALSFNSALPPLLGQSLPMLFRETVGDDIWFLLLLCTLAIHLHSGRRGVLMALGFYLPAFAIAVGQVLLAGARGEDDGSGAVIVQIYVMAGMLMSFLFVLARYREQTLRLQVDYALLEEMAFSDSLTGLPNRRQGYQLLQSQIALAQRSGRPLSVCLWDLDHFKQVNDVHGHDAGDQVLRGVAGRLKDLLRSSDTLVRWGGEEFLVILPDTELHAGAVVAERLCRAIAASPLAAGVPSTASFGVSDYVSGEHLEQLLQRADRALYAAKAAGRNQVVPMPAELVESVDSPYAA
jgi:diguanylate cyclase (GGDEF)-like protein